MRLKLVSVLAVFMVMLAGSAWAANIDGETYNDADLAILKEIKADNPGVLSTMNLDNPATEDIVMTAEDLAEQPFPPSVKVGDTVKLWLGSTLSTDDEFLGWIKVEDEWRVEFFVVAGAASFDASKLASLPYLGNLSFEYQNTLSNVTLPALDSLCVLEIQGKALKTIDISKLTSLTALQVIDTGVTSLTLPPSASLAYFKCNNNDDMTELSGYYAKEDEIKPFPWADNDIVRYNAKLTQHTITIAPPANGTVTKNGGDKIYNGDSVTFTVKANSGYKIGAVQINGASVTLTGETYTHKATSDVEVSAIFVEDNTPVTPPDDNDGNKNDNGGGGGCNVGYGLIGLLLAGFAVLRVRPVK
jgi:hypothetical protein